MNIFNCRRAVRVGRRIRVIKNRTVTLEHVLKAQTVQLLGQDCFETGVTSDIDPQCLGWEIKLFLSFFLFLLFTAY